MRKPAVSVIIPTFNRARLVVQAVASVFAQTVSDYEVIVVDDGSTDDTQAALISFTDRPQFHHLYQPNRGRSTARNLGIKQAQGDYLLLLDSDDILLPDALANLFQTAAQSPNAGLIVGATEFVDEQANVRHVLRPELKTGFSYPQLILPRFFLLPGAFIIRRECLAQTGSFDPDFDVAEDYDFALRAALYVELACLNRPVVQHRLHENNTPTLAVYRGVIAVALKHLALLERTGQLSATNRRLSRAAWMQKMGDNYYVLGENWAALENYLRALSIYPPKVFDLQMQRQMLASLLPMRLRSRLKPALQSKSLHWG